jgi:cytochrome c biogenesis protein CcmG/thiol:disulfide interchange protein DsbE
MAVKKNSLWVFLPLVFFVALAVLLALSLGKNPDLIPSARKGEAVPHFQLPSLLHQGETVTPAIFKGHWTLLNVWATWCPTCHIEHPFLMRLAQQGVRIVGADYKDEPDKARALLATNGNPYIDVFSDKDGSFGLDLGVYGAPETYVIDPQGKIVLRHVGALEERDWKEQILPVWKKPTEGASL